MTIDRSIFKAYDIRGVYPEQLNAEVVRVAVPAALKAIAKAGNQPKTIVVGHDARLSGPELYGACIEALRTQWGVRVIEAGLISTPMLYFLVNDKKADGGIMVTASHNPKQYNGLKVVRERAIPVSGKDILAYVER